jgi:uncharacterized membrane protein YuzA (DUF378 family)
METLQKICLTLTIIGAIAWGLIGLFDFNLIEALFGEGKLMTNLLYSLVGLAGIINIGLLLRHYEHDEVKR